MMLWDQWQLAKAYSERPSVMLQIEDRYAAFCVDGAVAHFGLQLEAELDGVNEKNPKTAKRKRQRIMEKWLGIPRKYRNPTAVLASNSQTEPGGGVRDG
jgi:hypothetical protein